MPKRSLLARAPEHCPSCGELLRFGLSEQHSVGPGPEGRFIRALAVPLGVLASVAVAMFTGVRWTAGHVIFGTGMMVGVLKKKLTTAGKINRRSKALFQAPEGLF